MLLEHSSRRLFDESPNPHIPNHSKTVLKPFSNLGFQIRHWFVVGKRQLYGIEYPTYTLSYITHYPHKCTAPPSLFQISDGSEVCPRAVRRCADAAGHRRWSE